MPHRPQTLMQNLRGNVVPQAVDLRRPFRALPRIDATSYLPTDI